MKGLLSGGAILLITKWLDHVGPFFLESILWLRPPSGSGRLQSTWLSAQILRQFLPAASKGSVRGVYRDLKQ